jgi:hypothetical protein
MKELSVRIQQPGEGTYVNKRAGTDDKSLLDSHTTMWVLLEQGVKESDSLQGFTQTPFARLVNFASFGLSCLHSISKNTAIPPFIAYSCATFK